MTGWPKRIFRFLASLKLAVITVGALSVALTAATLIESVTDIRTGRYWVYQSAWFYALLGLFGINILVVAISRWPWKRGHLPFLLAHAGILMILIGSLVTKRYGIDGSLAITEGETRSIVELEEMALAIEDRATHQRTIREVPWIPPSVAFKPIVLPEHRLRIDRFLTHADSKQEFVPQNGEHKRSSPSAPAFHFEIKGGPMQIRQEFWIWGGEASWSDLRMGPARIVLLPEGLKLGNTPSSVGEALLELRWNEKEGLSYRAVSMSGKKREGRVPIGKLENASLDTGWKQIQLTLLSAVPNAVNVSRYEPSMIEYGERAPPPAVRLVTGGHGQDAEVWLGLGEQATLESEGKTYDVAFVSRRVMLPFSLKLDRFEIQRYEGSESPSSYSSDVTIVDVGAPMRPVKISMNEPLEWGGYTFYQASYIPEDPRPKTSVFSVNRDPGRALKYWGSILLVLGSILLFVKRHLQARKAAAADKGGSK